MSEAIETVVNTDLKKMNEDFIAKMGEISNSVAGISKVVEDQSKTISKLATPPAKKVEDEDDDYSSLLFGNDKKKIDQLVERKAEQIVDAKLEAKSTEDQKFKKYESECKEWDGRAYKEIPLLNDNAEFKKEVQDHLAKTPIMFKKGDEAFYAPDAVYNAANAIFAKWVRMNKLNPSQLDTFQTLDTGGFGDRRIKGDKITDVQLEIARRLQIPDKRAQEIYEPWNKSGSPANRRRVL